jgi:hypothetical protein
VWPKPLWNSTATFIGIADTSWFMTEHLGYHSG